MLDITPKRYIPIFGLFCCALDLQSGAARNAFGVQILIIKLENICNKSHIKTLQMLIFADKLMYFHDIKRGILSIMEASIMYKSLSGIETK